MIESLFKSISEQMLKEFDISAWINHGGVKGSLREDALHNFLADGRLPKKYGITSGVVVTTLNTDQSNQLDLIIYDKNLCPVWIKSRSCQILPIEGIYGSIEVKSKLSKKQLQDGLKKIKSLRDLVPERCSFPFGIIFAYSLSRNSLNSLEKNLREFQDSHTPSEWPNLVVVLNEGIIFQKKGLETVFETEQFDRDTRPVAFHFGKDSLFQFYSFLFDSLNLKSLSPFSASRYIDQPVRIEDLIVRNNDYITKDDYKLLQEIVIYCHRHKSEKVKLRELYDLSSRVDSQEIHQANLDQEVYFYDPEHLRLDLKNLSGREDPRSVADLDRYLLDYVEINYEIYCFPKRYLYRFRNRS